MRGKQEDESLKKITVRIFERDYNIIKQAYPNVGQNGIIRRLVREHCERIEARRLNKKEEARAASRPVELTNDQIESELEEI